MTKTSPAMLAAALLTLTLSGCLGTPVNDVPDIPAEMAVGEPITITYFLTETGFLSTEPEEFGEIPINWNQDEWTFGITPPTWESEYSTYGRVITAIDVELHFKATQPTTSWPAVRSGFTAWVGTPEWIVDHHFFGGPDQMQPGDTFTGTDAADLPENGMYLPKGESLALSVGTYYYAALGGTGISLYGDEDHVNKVTITMTQFAETERLWSVFEEQTVDITSNQCSGYSGGIGPEIPVPELPANQTALRIDVATFGPGHADMDFFLHDPDGNYWGGAHGPGSLETIIINGTELAANPGQWTIKIWCMPQASTIEIQFIGLETPA